MLFLVLTYGDVIRLIQQDVSCHQRGVGEKAAVDVFSVLGALVLKLRHPAEFAEHGIAVEDPSELGVLMHMALDE